MSAIVILGNLFKTNGGLHSAVYLRLRLLAAQEQKVRLLTTQYMQNFESLVEFHTSNGNIPMNVEILNLYRHAPGLFLENINAAKVSTSDNIRPAFNQVEMTEYVGISRFKDINSHRNAYRVFEDGLYRRYETYRESGVIDYIDHFEEPWTRTHKSLFDERGNLTCKRHMDRKLNRPAFNQYFDSDGNCTISATVDLKSGTEQHFFFHNSGLSFSNPNDLLRSWINAIIRDDQSTIVFIDKRELVTSLLGIRCLGRLRFVYIMHSTHLGKPFTDPNIIEKSIEPLFENVEKIDRLVVLTERQKSHMVNHLNVAPDRIIVIPHPQASNRDLLVCSKPKHLAISMARYHYAKALHEAIESFRIVVKRFPLAEYHIYGYGPLKISLESLIDKLGLTQNVKLFDHCADPLNKLSEARCSIVTSLYEGFSMATTESLSVGTPVVSYDTLYGPPDIIRDGVDGFVVPWGARSQLADRIVSIFSDDSLSNQLATNAIEVSSRFSIERAAASWLSVFSDFE